MGHSNNQRRGYWGGDRVTRRGFVQGASALATFAAGATLVGCGDDDDAQPSSAAPTAAAPTAANPASPAARIPVKGGTLTLAFSLEPPDMDPTKTLSAGLHTVVTPIYSKLVRTVLPLEAKNAQDFTITADLAETWEQVDLQTYTFKLHKGVTWHDIAPLNGRALVAADVKFALTAYAAGGPHASAFDLIDSISTPDDQTVAIKLKEPFALFLDAVSNATRQIFAPEAAQRSGGGLSATPVIGTGPFVFKNFSRGTSFEATRNPKFFRAGYPHLDGYKMLLISDPATRVASFRAGAVHAISPSWAESQAILGTHPKTVFEEGVAVHSTFNLGMNTKKPPFNDPRVRRAISMGFDRKATVDSIFGGHAITGWGIPWGFVQKAPWTAEQLGPWNKYNVTEAKKLLDAAGFSKGFKTTLFFFQYTADMASQIQLFQAEMKANLNIDIELQPLDYATYFNRVTSRDWDGTAWAFQIGSSASVDDFLYKNMRTGGGGNYYYIADPEIDKRVERIRAEPDAAARTLLIKEVVAIDQDMMYRVFQPMYNGFQVADPKYQGWSPNRQFRGSLGYGTDSFEQSWLTA